MRPWTRVVAGACALAGRGDGSTGLPQLPAPTCGGGDLLQLIRHQDLDSGYTVHIPASARADTPAPVLVIRHGAGQDGPGTRTLIGIGELTDALGWIVLYPGGVELSWAIGTETPADLRGIDDVGFIRRMLDRVRDGLDIDEQRVAGTMPADLAERSRRRSGIFRNLGREVERVRGESPERPVQK